MSDKGYLPPFVFPQRGLIVRGTDSVERCSKDVPQYEGRVLFQHARCDLIKDHNGHCRNDDGHKCSPECPT